ncbi:MAG: 3-oxoacyl-[acyl-carrier-protein] synthase III C-terminal domain-containing protein [Pseudomonadota bacterium]
MFVTGIGTANPTQRYSKAECWEAFTCSDWFTRLGPRSRSIAEAVLFRDNGIDSRHLAVKSLREVFNIDPDALYARFLSHAPLLASQAGEVALANAQVDAKQIDGVVVSTCTGYLCPGISGYVIEQLQLRPEIQAFDLVGQGCAAALPNWQLANALLSSGQCRHVLSICVEVCSAAMYLDDDPGVLISACLFGDGAGAAVLSKSPGVIRRRIEWTHSASLINPSKRKALLFEQRQGMLRNVLTREVPQLAAGHAYQVLKSVLRSSGVSQAEIRTWVMHAGGRDVLAALQERFGVEPTAFRYSAAILRDYGNMSSAFIYYVLQAALKDKAASGWWWMSTFGAGFSCHGALLEVS